MSKLPKLAEIDTKIKRYDRNKTKLNRDKTHWDGDKNPSHLFFDNQIPCEWFTTFEAAEFLRISPNALRICVHRGQIRAYKFGRRLRFRRSELLDLFLGKGA